MLMKNVSKLVILFVSVIITGICFSSNVGAISGEEQYWSWVDKPPTIALKEDRYWFIDSCRGSVQYRKTSIFGAVKKFCLTMGETLDFGTTGQSVLPEYYIGFSNDTKMHSLMIPSCGAVGSSCTYLPEKDMLIIRPVSGYVNRELLIYRNFSKRLSKIDAFDKEYRFDEASPDYTFNHNGVNVRAMNIGVSKNNKWLVAELHNDGYTMLNLETFEMRRFAKVYLRYGYGMDPNSEIVVSNDGRHVAIGGANSGLMVFDVNDTCSAVYSNDYYSKECPKFQFNSSYIDRFSSAYGLGFSSDGGELHFIALTHPGQKYNIVLRANGYQGDFLNYLALGDSYTSGEGDLDDENYISGTNSPLEKCHLSVNSYPFILSRMSGFDDVKTKSVACSGAVMGDVLGKGEYWGQGGRLSVSGQRLPSEKTESQQLQASAIFDFIPGRARQMEFVEKYQPKAITVGIGGNDAGFMDKLKACLGPDNCDIATDIDLREKSAKEIQGLYSKFSSLYTEIYNKSPNSKIYVIGYPKIIDENGDCGVVKNTLLSYDERKFINEGIVYLNQTIEAAAINAGVKYIDIENSFGNHVICGGSQPSAINDVVLGDDIGLIESYEWLNFIGGESFHPNALGHSYNALAIYDSVGDITTFDNCGSGKVVCPVANTAPEPSDYWIDRNNPSYDYTEQKKADFVYDEQSCQDGTSCRLILPANSLMADSTVKVEIHSTPRLLSELSTDSTGSMDIMVDFPQDLEEGFHMLHVLGKSISGDDIDLYQVIKYQKVSLKTVSQVVDIPAPIDENNIQTDGSVSSPQINQITAFTNSQSEILNTKTAFVAGSDDYNQIENDWIDDARLAFLPQNNQISNNSSLVNNRKYQKQSIKSANLDLQEFDFWFIVNGLISIGFISGLIVLLVKELLLVKYKI